MKRTILKLVRAPETFTLILLLVTLAIGRSYSDRFLHIDYLLGAKFADFAPIALLALAMTFIIIAGQIDLSVGSGAVLVMVSIGLLYRDAHCPMWLLVIIGPLFGAVLGLFNGFLITALRLPALVVTLGTLALYRGLAQVLIGEATVGKMPAWFSGVDSLRVFGMQIGLVIAFLGVALVAAIVLKFTTFGRIVYAIGTNEAAARYAAIPTDRIKLVLFALSGFAMGAAAIVNASVKQNISYKHFKGDELTAITAVVLGGTSIFGGRGSILGTVLAVFLLVAVQSAMGIQNVQADNRLAIVGTLLIGSVIVNDLIGRFRQTK